ncbi:hypothetical protein LJR175_008217 [Variovorax sp. LjRoot175]|uniref:hypothetical protein n=1 Tax=Variovorax sp. LjRoot175 TaxID=3342276 RepID=UPI003ECCAAB5
MAKIYDAETQFLTVAFTKEIGVNSDDRVISFDPRETGRDELGLSPLLVYNVIAPAFKRCFRMVVDARAPLAISHFLAAAWQSEVQLGMPMTLEAKQQILRADLGFVAWIRAQGVSVIPPSSIKSINAFERASQDLRFAVHWRQSSYRPRPLSFENANEALLDHDRFCAPIHHQTSMGRHNFDMWDSREKRFVKGAPIPDDWSATPLVEHPRARPDPSLKVDVDDDPAHVDGIKHVLAMWPNGRGAALKELGIKAADFDFWVQERSHLYSDDFTRLRVMLNLEYHDHFGEWMMGGGYLLIAKHPKDIVPAYEALSYGGDLEFSFEIVGPHGEQLPARFLVFSAWSGLSTIILFERGGAAEAVLDSGKLINLEAPRKASPDVWKDVAHVVEHQQSFASPEKIGAAFYKMHVAWFEQNTTSGFIALSGS